MKTLDKITLPFRALGIFMFLIIYFIIAICYIIEGNQCPNCKRLRKQQRIGEDKYDGCEVYYCKHCKRTYPRYYM